MTDGRTGHVLVIHYDGNYMSVDQCEVEYTANVLQSNDPVCFGLPATSSIIAVIQTPDVDMTAVIMEGEYAYQGDGQDWSIF